MSAKYPLKKFQHQITAVGYMVINIEFKEKLENIDVKKFINNYKISNVWKGKFFLKRLIKKVFKYKLKKEINWDNNFWNNIEISLLKTEITLIDKHNFEKSIKNKTKPNRFDDIQKYQTKLRDRIDLGHSLYISGRCINYLGGNIDINTIFILDGSRRLVANILNNSNPNILLIDLKEEISE